ncbi:MAG: hypothetical protein WD926_00590 [Patescibacteria group bacterium]
MPSQRQSELPKPLKTFRTGVDRREIGGYYLRCELHRLLSDKRALRTLLESIEKLDEEIYWRFLAGISHTYRCNWVFWEVSNERYTWNEEQLAVADLIMTGMGNGTEMTKFIRGIHGDTGRFLEILGEYRAGKTEGYPSYLGQIPNEPVDKEFATLLVRGRGGKLRMFDGMNRLIQQMANGAESIRAYRAVDNGGPDRRRVTVGPVLLLRELDKASSDDETHQAIERTVRKLGEYATDGKSIIKHWEEYLDSRSR